MSFDPGVFYTTKPHTDTEALKHYVAYCEESDLTPYIEPSIKISEFVKELTALHPQIDEMPEDQLDECPWSIAFDLSEGHVLMPMVWSKADETSKIIVDLAKKHGLACFDPKHTNYDCTPGYSCSTKSLMEILVNVPILQKLNKLPNPVRSFSALVHRVATSIHA